MALLNNLSQTLNTLLYNICYNNNIYDHKINLDWESDKKNEIYKYN